MKALSDITLRNVEANLQIWSNTDDASTANFSRILQTNFAPLKRDVGLQNLFCWLV